jgi:hypothetical protein
MNARPPGEKKPLKKSRDMGTVNSSVSSSSATILSDATPASVTNTIFLSTAPTSIIAGVHTAEVISTWDSHSPAERSSTTVVVPTEAGHTELKNGIIARQDETGADDQRVSAPTQHTSLPISLTKRDHLKDKPNNESPAIQRARQHSKGVTPPYISLTGRRQVKDIPHPGHRKHHIYHMVPVNDPPQYFEEDTSHSTLQLTGKHHLNTFPAPVSTTQQASLETDTSFVDVVTPSDEYTTPFDDDVDIPPELDSTELKRRSVPSEEPLAANSSNENTTINDVASTPGSSNIPPTPSETIPSPSSKQVPQPQNEISLPHKSPRPPCRLHRNSAVPLDCPTPPKRNSAVPQDRPSSSAVKKRDPAPEQQYFSSQQHPLTAQEKAPKQRRRQKSPQQREEQIEPASWTVAHPPPKETERSKWTVSNPPPREKEGGRYSVANPASRNGGERMRLSHYPMRKIQLFGRRHRGCGGDSSEDGAGKELQLFGRRRGGGNSTEDGGKEAD